MTIGPLIAIGTFDGNGTSIAEPFDGKNKGHFEDRGPSMEKAKRHFEKALRWQKPFDGKGFTCGDIIFGALASRKRPVEGKGKLKALRRQSPPPPPRDG